MAVVKSHTSSVYITNASNTKHGVKREKLSFSNVDASLVLLSMLTVLIDLTTDIILVVTYYLAGHTFWALSTVALAVIPAVVIQAFSIRWHILDEAATRGKWLSHFCLLGVFFRQVDVLQTGLEARRSGDVADFQLLFHQQSDICMLHLFESFMESAPQLVLQLYIMIQVHDWGPWTGISAGASLVSLAWAIAAYTRAMRRARPEKRKATWSGLILQAIWRAGLLAARVTALVLFAICCQAWLFLLLGFHWLGMTVWVVFQKTDLCSTPWEECAYNCVVGVVYCFCFFNLREGRARGRMLAFYVVTVSQNLACLYLFLALAQHTHPVLATLGASIVVGGTIIGLSAMLLYYRFFHPSGPITLFGPPVSSSTAPESEVERQSRQPPQQQPPSALPYQPQAQDPIQVDRSVQAHLQTLEAAPQMPTDTEKTNSLRSLKHLWSIDRDGSLSSRSDEIPIHGGSPQSDDGCTDKRTLLSSNGPSRRPIPAFSGNSSLQKEGGLIPTTAQVETGVHISQSGLSNLSNRLSQTSIANQSCASNLTSRSTLTSQSLQSAHSIVTARSAQSLLSNHSNQSAHLSHTSQSTLSVHSNQSRPSVLTVKPLETEEAEIQVKGSSTFIDINDSKLSWNCTSMMEDTQHSEISDSPSEDLEGRGMSGGSGLNKRRGICSSVELGLDKLEEEKDVQDISGKEDVSSSKTESDESFVKLCRKLVDNAEVKQLGSIELVKREMKKRLKDIPGNEKEEKEDKREPDYIDSKQSAISSDGTPSEVLSAHDYENICAVNIAREAWGLRSWRGYSDIETWLHDDSVVRDRRRDTLASVGTATTVTSASSELSATSDSPPLPRLQWESPSTCAPPLPCRRPRPSYNRMDDYLDTLAYDLAEIENQESAVNVFEETQGTVFVAQPYVVDQHGMMYPLPASLDTILEEMEESSATASTVTGTDSVSTAPGRTRSLVATIDEIRGGTSMCIALDDTLAMSESDFEVGSYRSLQLDSSIVQHFPSKASPQDECGGQHRFSNSLPSLLQAPRCWSHLTPEEVLFLSKLKPLPENDNGGDLKHSSSGLSTNDLPPEKTGQRPRRKFSLLREKFEVKQHPEKGTHSVTALSDDNCGVKDSLNTLPQEETSFSSTGRPEQNTPFSLTKTAVDKWNDIVHIQNEGSSSVGTINKDLKSTEWTVPEETFSYGGRNFLKQVITEPRFAPRNKKLPLASNASA